MKFLMTLFFALLAGTSMAQTNDFEKVEIKTIPVSGRVSMLEGRGGNIAVFVGDKYTLLVDDQFAPLTNKIVAAVRGLTALPIRFVVNTHWHGDHTGGNENLGKAGAVIVAHDNVHKRMSEKQLNAFFNKTSEASPTEALPVITFDDSVKFRLSGETILVRSIGPAHTDSDSLVYFQDSNVLHTGDTFFAGKYPYIDVSTGGSINGVIRALKSIVELTNEETRIIPGHGPLSTPNDVRESLKMMETLRERVRVAMVSGQSDEEIVNSKMTADFDEKFGGGFISGPKFLQLLCDSLRSGG